MDWLDRGGRRVFVGVLEGGSVVGFLGLLIIGGAGGEGGDAKGFCVDGGREDERWEVWQEGRVCRDGGRVKSGDGGDAGGDAKGFQGGTGDGGSTFVVGATDSVQWTSGIRKLVK